MNINTKASVVSIKQDIATIINAVQSYVIINKDINKIQDAVTLNTSVWNVSEKEVKYEDCISITINKHSLNLLINAPVSKICTQLSNAGIINQVYNLN